MSRNDPKILLAGEEVCGYIGVYQRAFETLGYYVKSAIYKTDPTRSDFTYDYNFEKYDVNIPFKKLLGKNAVIRKLLFLIKQNRIKKRFVEKEAVKFDVIIYLWRTLMPNYYDVKYLKQKGCKLMFLFVGSEIRYNKLFLKKYDFTGLDTSYLEEHMLTKQPIDVRLDLISVAEKYADIIYSAPDMDGLQTKPYYHVQVPMDVDSFEFINNKRKVPVVVHAPSNPGKKGTDVIEKTLSKLKKEGLSFEYRKLQGLSNTEVKSFLMDADILVDELIFHGPGTLSFEAMLSGCAVATRYLDEYSLVFNPPVLSINTRNIYYKVKQLILDFDLRQKLIVDGYKYAKENNDSYVLANRILENLYKHKEPDYFPKLELEYFNNIDQKRLSEYKCPY